MGAMKESDKKATLKKEKKSLHHHLDDVDYAWLNSNKYTPYQESLKFMNFIKLVNGHRKEGNKTPPMHLRMIDKLVEDRNYVANLCFRGSGKTTLFMEYLVLYLAMFGEWPHLGKVHGVLYISDSMDNGAKSARKNIEFRFNESDFLQEWIPEAKFTDGMLEFKNKAGHQLGVRLFGATTGLRGTKIYGKRPVIAILDDLVSDEMARSKVTMNLIRDTVYKGVNHALDPTKRKVIFNGTPFNKDDVLVEAVESGGWNINVWPVCEKFPCPREEFRGAWEDRFSYDYIQDQYDLAVATGKTDAFYQELMLRLSNDEDRLIQEAEIGFYSRQALLSQREKYNFYITTDFAVSARQSADFNVISVWAYGGDKNWYWVDGICKRQTLDRTIESLFNLVTEYEPQQVGIEIAGQQGGFIQWIQKEMAQRDIWFNFASNSPNKTTPGIRPVKDKLSRFNRVVPLFKQGKIKFPQEMQGSIVVGEFLQELRLVTHSGIKGKDDCLDTISMLSDLDPWNPVGSAEPTTISTPQSPLWDDHTHEQRTGQTGYESYIV